MIGSSVRRVFPVILAAPSGAGKTTIAQALRARRPDVVFSVSATTRAPRPYEQDGRDYHFVSEAEFRREADAGELVEWAEVHGHLYGTPRRNLEGAAAAGEYLLLDIDVQGSQQIRHAAPEAVAIFVLPPSGRELAARLAARGSEDEAVRMRRLRNACRELLEAPGFDYVIVNDDLDTAVDAVESILASESNRANRISDLRDRVRAICADVSDASPEVDGVAVHTD